MVADFKQDVMWACDKEKLNPPDKLVRAGPEHFAKHFMRSSSLPWIHRPQHMPDDMFLQRESMGGAGKDTAAGPFVSK